jgi:signal transduction histidine kinase
MEVSDNLLILIVLGTLGMLLLASVITIFIVVQQRKFMGQREAMQQIELNYRKALITNTVQAEEAERKKIARNIHDDIATILQVTKLQVTSLKNKQNISDIHEPLAGVGVQLGQAIETIRRISRDLSPPVLDRLGFVEALKDHLERIEDGSDVSIEYQIDSEVDIKSKIDEIQLFRIILELLNNLLKYAHPNFIKVSASTLANQSILISIQHDGDGLDQREATELSTSTAAFGLSSVFSRAMATGTKVIFAETKDHISLEYAEETH